MWWSQKGDPPTPFGFLRHHFIVPAQLEELSLLPPPALYYVFYKSMDLYFFNSLEFVIASELFWCSENPLWLDLMSPWHTRCIISWAVSSFMVILHDVPGSICASFRPCVESASPSRSPGFVQVMVLEIKIRTLDVLLAPGVSLLLGPFSG